MPFAPVIDAESLPASGLTWSGASADELEFMRRVYDRHVARASRSRSFVADIPASNLDTVEGRHQLRSDAAQDCRAMLAEARTELSRQQAQGINAAQRVRSIGVTSGYRSASRQFQLWQSYFPRYFRDTQAHRAGLSGGELGDRAVDYMAGYVAARIAAPGYSLHNNGIAVDLTTREEGHTLGASSRDIPRWQRSWLFAWLTTNASRFNFYQNTRINEPWHWEYRPSATSTSEMENGWEGLQEAVTTPRGEMQLSNTPLLSSHRGTQPDLILRWNDFQDTPTVVDVVVHLHGYSGSRDRMSLVNDKLPHSGLDFANPDNPSDPTPGRARATLGIIPRGHYFGGNSGMGYSFPALTGRNDLENLITYGFGQFSTQVGLSNLQRGRLILTAHSGGGAALLSILANATISPDEIYVFDGLYTQNPAALVRWLQNRIARDAAALTSSSDPARTMREQGGALCVLYIPCSTNSRTRQIQNSGTKAGSEIVQRAIATALANQPSILANYYRVEHTSVGHNNIPRRFGWRLLADAATILPHTTRLGTGRRFPTCQSRTSDAVSEVWGDIFSESNPDRHSRDYIRWVQRSLNQLIGAGLAVDGIQGPLTRSAIRTFQSQNSLTVDGIVGPQTEAALIAAGASPPPHAPTPSPPSPPTPPTPITPTHPDGVSASFVSRIQSLTLSNAAEINDYFTRTTQADFVDWFNDRIAQRDNWSRLRIGRAGDTAAVKARFTEVWNRIPIMFGTSSINLMQFFCLVSIMINETGGTFSPITERVGRTGHPGIAYAFDRIPNLKRSYNGGSNKTAFELFNDPEFIAAHGTLPLADRLRNTTDRRWAGERYPQEDFPTSTDPAITGFILEADFYKFRGRGLIQTTFRGSYRRVIEQIQTQDLNHPLTNEYRQRWAGMNLDTVATRSTNQDWDRLFQETDYRVAAVAIRLHSRHSGNYLNLPLNADTLNGDGAGSIYYVGYRVSGGRNYAALFRRRVLQLVNGLGNAD